MKRKEIGLEIKLEEGAKIASIQLSDETVAYLDSIWGKKTYVDYLKEFLVDEENFEKADKAVMRCMEDSLPKDIKENCKYCKGETEDEGYKLCTKYYLQMKATFSMVAGEFVNIVLSHKHIYDNKDELQQLTKNFFNCLIFISGRGVILIDLERLSRYALDANFKSLSQLFRSSRVLKSLEIINNSLDALSDQEMENKVLQQEDENYIELQKEFFEQKQGVYEKKLLIEKEKSNLNQISKKVKKTKQSKNNNFSQKQIAIAYFIKGIVITSDNYLEILRKHSSTKSEKILQKRIYKPNELTRLSQNKTTDSKHLKDLQEAKRLLNNLKDTKAVNDLEAVISTFTSNYNANY
ncbi:hypothetical protein J8L88_12540 [Aquimarina sp. MMG015]|uniref:hypothetical protein n=1 Tax=unclassified Aquimarina TaxID=2627091 RepID=UPI000E542E5E|nr:MULTISPECIES: hypothetical protein [unclassified Aquimarina]AXT56219.1 hypothetical protein D1815_10805 [Aquimarina sp. AD1]MBQ4803682.1 hypothetical protein [Aquimarina sp. MMG015]RKN34215.1 hypothetical protein D7035_04790 [Aquimarina sp. AD1]